VGNYSGPNWGIPLNPGGEFFWPQVGNYSDPNWGIILTPTGEFFWTSTASFGTFYTVVFERIYGKQKELDNLELNGFLKWGKSLGQLHKVIKEIPSTLEIKRKTHEQLFENLIIQYPPKDEIETKEIESIRAWMKTLTKNDNDYGIIHYDFELDNIIWSNNGLYIIDFDDAIYSWFVADIAYALSDLFDEGEKVNINDKKFLQFIKGYREMEHISDEQIDQIPGFYKYHNFITYKKLEKSIDLTIDDKNPDWMNDLILKLEGFKESCYNKFKENGKT